MALFGQTAMAVRLAAAVIGSLTTLPVYLLGKSWFGGAVGILAAWLWAITLWPVHLSRIGLRVVLLVPLLAVAFWLGTMAYRRENRWFWIAAGLVYGLSFYTYLAARFTPLLLVLLAVYLLLIGRGRRLWPGAVWFLMGSFISLLPLLFVIIPQPELFLGRTGQVSVLHPDVNNGDLWGTLWRQIVAALGMFLWQGDHILRHNPAGRPVFDLIMAVPFLIGLLWCIRKWRMPAAMSVILWTGIMLGPTILAEDAPHFLRAAGVLPVILFFPSIGLEKIWRWPRLPQTVRVILVGGLILGSLLITIRDYTAYGRNPELDDVYEAAATRLAQQINDEGSQTAVFLDQRLWSSWPSISFLVTEPDQVQRYSNLEDLPQPASVPAAIYAWPYETLDFVPEVLASASQIAVDSGDLVPGVQDNPPYSLFVRYGSELLEQESPPVANFSDLLQLNRTEVVELEDGQLQVDVYWQADNEVEDDLVVFIHVFGNDGLIGQDDVPLAQGRWSGGWWRPDLQIRERHVVNLDAPFEASQHAIFLGLYRASDGQRLPVYDADSGESVGDNWLIVGDNE